MTANKVVDMAVNEKLLGQLIAGYQKPEDLVGEIDRAVSRNRQSTFEPMIVPREKQDLLTFQICL